MRTKLKLTLRIYVGQSQPIIIIAYVFLVNTLKL